MPDNFQVPYNDWDRDKAKDTIELRKKLKPNIDMRDFRRDVLDVLKKHIDSGHVAHVALFITFDDGGNKYYCADEQANKSSLII